MPPTSLRPGWQATVLVAVGGIATHLPPLSLKPGWQPTVLAAVAGLFWQPLIVAIWFGPHLGTMQPPPGAGTRLPGHLLVFTFLGCAGGGGASGPFGTHFFPLCMKPGWQPTVLVAVVGLGPRRAFCCAASWRIDDSSLAKAFAGSESFSTRIVWFSASSWQLPALCKAFVTVRPDATQVLKILL